MTYINNLITNIGYRKILALILTPFVFVGMFLVYKNAQISRKAYSAGDPLIVTYTPEGPPPNPPMFVVSNMLPGDEYPSDGNGKLFNVKNGSDEDESVVMDAIMTIEEKNFADILDIEIIELPSTNIFSGKLQAFLDSPPINLGNFAPGADKTYRVKVKFPSSAENEYQLAKVVFDIIWQTQGPEIEIPRDCSAWSGLITRVVEGTEGNDFIFGTRASELFILKGGNDLVFGGKGDDVIIGGEGNDFWLDGSDGNDCIIGGPGNDKLDGSDDYDLLYGNEGNDKIDGSDDDDLIYGGDGNDNIDAGGNNDKVWGGIGNDNIEGGAGNDEIHGEEGNDTIDGESGNDKLYGESGNDNIKGGSGQDFLDGGPDTDTQNGGSNTDTCINGETNTSCEL